MEIKNTIQNKIRVVRVILLMCDWYHILIHESTVIHSVGLFSPSLSSLPPERWYIHILLILLASSCLPHRLPHSPGERLDLFSWNVNRSLWCDCELFALAPPRSQREEGWNFSVAGTLHTGV